MASAAERPEPTVLDGVSPSVVGARVDCAATTTCTVTWELARAPVRIYAGAAPGSIDRSTPAGVVTTGTEITLANPDPGAPRYFEVVAKGRRHGPVVADRFLPLEGTRNARDLGGYQTVDGRTTKWGRLFRADGLGGLTDTDRSRLAALGLPAECPEATDTTGGVPEASPTADALAAAASAVTTKAARQRDRALLLRLLRDPDPQWVQCTLFDDRFGWSASLVLASLGVSKETVAADHLRGTPVAAPPLPDRRYLDLAFAAIEERYGDWGTYLGQGLGLDQRTYDRLRKRYVSGL